VEEADFRFLRHRTSPWGRSYSEPRLASLDVASALEMITLRGICSRQAARAERTRRSRTHSAVGQGAVRRACQGDSGSRDRGRCTIAQGVGIDRSTDGGATWKSERGRAAILLTVGTMIAPLLSLVCTRRIVRPAEGRARSCAELRQDRVPGN
jgi:hypothetical protein